ncbi:MAG: hypothetical protein NUV80_01775 [Candidatus Berkelbacteria bacterium]|nr:hypothetical protein [Candidatus Berkelbacteria bacterium]MCR4307267.1 hypothetical protein [Candidatus Berkelbacteria bacterium]
MNDQTQEVQDLVAETIAQLDKVVNEQDCFFDEVEFEFAVLRNTGGGTKFSLALLGKGFEAGGSIGKETGSTVRVKVKRNLTPEMIRQLAIRENIKKE